MRRVRKKVRKRKVKGKGGDAGRGKERGGKSMERKGEGMGWKVRQGGWEEKDGGGRKVRVGIR